MRAPFKEELADFARDLSEDLRELRVRADGEAEAAREFGDRSAEALLDRISGAIQRALDLTEELNIGEEENDVQE